MLTPQQIEEQINLEREQVSLGLKKLTDQLLAFRLFLFQRLHFVVRFFVFVSLLTYNNIYYL